MKTTIIIPTYNERANISSLIPSIFSKNPDTQVLIVDDNSPDGTADVVRSLQTRFPKLKLLSRQGKEGLGKAYIHGYKTVIEEGLSDTIVMMDADLSHDPEYLEKMLELREKYDVVVSSRYIKGGSTRGWELWRRILSRYGNFYAKTITRMPIKDCTGGFNAINVNTLKKIDFNKMNLAGYAFIMHLKYLLLKEGATVIEMPICFKNRIEGNSKISNSIIKEGIIAPWKMILKK